MRQWLFVVAIVIVIGMAFFPILRPGILIGETIAGVDANKDGVRDDLEKLIEAKYSYNPKVRSVARQLAKTYQAEIENPNTTPVQPGLDAVDCLVDIADLAGDEILKTIQATAANTFERARALIRYSARFNGQILSSSQNPCSFDPELSK